MPSRRRTGLCLALLTTLALSACGGDDPSRPAAGRDQTFRTAQTTTTAPASTTPNSTPSGIPATRLVAGPVLFRITDAPKPTETNSTPQILYLTVFRLNRAPKAKKGKEALALDPVGNYSIVDPNPIWGSENPIFRFTEGTGRYCYAGIFDRETVPPDLQAFRPGQRVPMTLQPTTPAPSGNLVLGANVYKRSPRLLRADYRLESKRARAALQRIGCIVSPGPLFGLE